MVDNKERITILFDLFMQGKTSVEEENELTEYFRSEMNLPAEWEDYKTMFAYFDNGMVEKQQKNIPQKEKKSVELWHRVAIAASILLFIGGAIVWFLSQKNTENIAQTSVASVSKIEKIIAENTENGLKEEEIAQKKSRGDVEKLVYSVSKKSKKIAKNKCIGTVSKSTRNSVPHERNIEISDEEYINIAHNIEKINMEIAQAQHNVYVASQQAQGIWMIYDEDGTIYHRNCSSQTKNIIEL